MIQCLFERRGSLSETSVAVFVVEGHEEAAYGAARAEFFDQLPLAHLEKREVESSPFQT